jgi:hypothetical protein
MDKDALHSPAEIFVLGIGHLAAAVRVQLRMYDISPVEECVARENPHVLVACSDHECASTFANLCSLIAHERSLALLAWITNLNVRLVVSPGSILCRCVFMSSARYDFSLSDSACIFRSTPTQLTLNPDTCTRHLARFAAPLIARELCTLRRQPVGLFGGASGCAGGQITEFDPLSPQPRRHPATGRPDCPVCRGAPLTPGCEPSWCRAGPPHPLTPGAEAGRH